MSTESDMDRVFVEYEEQTYSLFTFREQAMLHKGVTDKGIIKKLEDMTFRQFEYESLFIYFERFLSTLPGWWTPDTTYQFNLVRKFARKKMNDFVKEEEMSKNEDFDFMEATVSEDFVEITVSGHTFEDDNLIAL